MFDGFWPIFALVHFLASFGAFYLSFAGIFADFWPIFAALVFIKQAPVMRMLRQVCNFWPDFAHFL
jgi:hypothetical protein